MRQEALPFGGGGSGGVDPSRLLPMLNRQHELARQLDELSLRQADAIERDDTDGLLAVLEEREPVVAQIVALSRELTPFAKARGFDPAEREEMERHVAAVETLIARVNERDRACQGRLETRRNQIATELASMRTGRGAVAAYGGGGGANGPRFQDREG